MSTVMVCYLGASAPEFNLIVLFILYLLVLCNLISRRHFRRS